MSSPGEEFPQALYPKDESGEGSQKKPDSSEIPDEIQEPLFEEAPSENVPIYTGNPSRESQEEAQSSNNWWKYAKRIWNYTPQNSTLAKKLGLGLGKGILLPLVVGVGATVDGFLQMAGNFFPAIKFLGSVALALFFGAVHLIKGWIDPSADLTKSAASYFFNKAVSFADGAKNFLYGLGKFALGSTIVGILVGGTMFGILPLAAAAAGPLAAFGSLVAGAAGTAVSAITGFGSTIFTGLKSAVSYIGANMVAAIGIGAGVTVIAGATLKKWWGGSKQDTQNKPSASSENDGPRSEQASTAKPQQQSNNVSPSQSAQFQAARNAAQELQNQALQPVSPPKQPPKAASPVIYSPQQSPHANRALASSIPLTQEQQREIQAQERNINKAIQAHGVHGTFKMEENTPKFSGKDPVSALKNCENALLKGLSYTLTLPPGSSHTIAEKLLQNAGANNLRISKVCIGTTEYSITKNNNNSYQVSPPRAPSLPSQAQQPSDNSNKRYNPTGPS